ncbi:DUF502 domain-containing protein [Metallumcola ferriviriculae]|uniref:DUF502 domain-containing protein n=1 Tax=Metallumcola ferriviriculae TaxID=3039180 RepID=A0AAU0UTH8_9FIRM|nr:DUF502 domain-containing protein [Desulfitibacteraceae bacterium MK1]
MKRIAKYFINGLITLLPIFLTVFIVAKVFSFSDNLVGQFLRQYGVNMPGLGLLIALAVITLVGFLATSWFSNKIFSWIDSIFSRTPLVKTIYTILKDTISSFTGEKKSFSKMAMINLGNDLKVLGFVTAEDLELFGLSDHVAIYVQQSMQWAGNLVLVPKDRVTLLDIPVEDGMKFLVSAGIAGNGNNKVSNKVKARQ